HSRLGSSGKGADCGDVRFGSEADICSAKRHVRFTPNSDRESRHPQTVMSALPPKADMCDATREVRFGPKADSCSAEKTVRYSITSSAREIRVETWRLDFAARAGRRRIMDGGRKRNNSKINAAKMRMSDPQFFCAIRQKLCYRAVRLLLRAAILDCY